MKMEAATPLPALTFGQAIGDALKGCGFQSVEKCLECDLQDVDFTCNKQLLNNLDKLVHKELDKNQFSNVGSLMKCILQCCNVGACSFGVLFNEGVISKTVKWFERATEFLFLGDHELVTPSLTALFYTYFDLMIVMAEYSKESANHIFENLFHLTSSLVTDLSVKFLIRLEAVRALNVLLNTATRDVKKKFCASMEANTLMKECGEFILKAGDYELQVAVMEVLCRLTKKEKRKELSSQWFDVDFVVEAFCAIKDSDFETDCRNFLNMVNGMRQDECRIVTLPCISVYLEDNELQMPNDKKLEKFWIDFNKGSKRIAFFIADDEDDDNKDGFWESISIHEDVISSYEIKICNAEQVLYIHMTEPVVALKMKGNMIHIHFEYQFDVLDSVQSVYGEKKCKKAKETKQMPEAVGPITMGTEHVLEDLSVRELPPGRNYFSDTEPWTSSRTFFQVRQSYGFSDGEIGGKLRLPSFKKKSSCREITDVGMKGISFGGDREEQHIAGTAAVQRTKRGQWKLLTPECTREIESPLSQSPSERRGLLDIPSISLEDMSKKLSALRKDRSFAVPIREDVNSKRVSDVMTNGHAECKKRSTKASIAKGTEPTAIQENGFFASEDDQASSPEPESGSSIKLARPSDVVRSVAQKYTEGPRKRLRGNRGPQDANNTSEKAIDYVDMKTLTARQRSMPMPSRKRTSGGVYDLQQNGSENLSTTDKTTHGGTKRQTRRTAPVQAASVPKKASRLRFKHMFEDTESDVPGSGSEPRWLADLDRRSQPNLKVYTSNKNSVCKRNSNDESMEYLDTEHEALTKSVYLKKSTPNLRSRQTVSLSAMGATERVGRNTRGQGQVAVNKMEQQQQNRLLRSIQKQNSQKRADMEIEGFQSPRADLLESPAAQMHNLKNELHHDVSKIGTSVRNDGSVSYSSPKSIENMRGESDISGSFSFNPSLEPQLSPSTMRRSLGCASVTASALSGSVSVPILDDDGAVFYQTLPSISRSGSMMVSMPSGDFTPPSSSCSLPTLNMDTRLLSLVKDADWNPASNAISNFQVPSAKRASELLTDGPESSSNKCKKTRSTAKSRHAMLTRKASCEMNKSTVKAHNTTSHYQLAPVNSNKRFKMASKKSQNDLADFASESTTREEGSELESDVGDLNDSVSNSYQAFAAHMVKLVQAKYNKIEGFTKYSLRSTEKQMTRLWEQLREQRHAKLQEMQKVILRELRSADKDCQVLKQLEEDSVKFWKEQTRVFSAFTSKQEERLKMLKQVTNMDKSIADETFAIEDEAKTLKTNLKDKESRLLLEMQKHEKMKIQQGLQVVRTVNSL
uniref:synaptonemal complex protein 2-like n=1 Tax=Myxine glutinosa TaxID=7769 RepID=UPI00358F117F